MKKNNWFEGSIFIRNSVESARERIRGICKRIIADKPTNVFAQLYVMGLQRHEEAPGLLLAEQEQAKETGMPKVHRQTNSDPGGSLRWSALEGMDYGSR
ncbi:hypothetical protein PUN28_014497 [Cardiocondyla obscurior]|uniref:Uncharacterized protein n=1 Tax=Cardiocondyla obscurior TaxID=286306 RepID=A0AAW2F5H9_9HYME